MQTLQVVQRRWCSASVTVAKGLFAGRVPADSLYPYPAPEAGDSKAAVLSAVERVQAAGMDLKTLCGAFGEALDAAPRARVRAAEALGAVDLGTALAVYHHELACSAAAAPETAAAHAEALAQMRSGEHLAAFCITETSAGSDVSRIETTATREGEDYVLAGEKLWVANAAEARYFVVFAQTEVDGKKKLSSFLVDKTKAEGLTVAAPLAARGLRAGQAANVKFNGVRVPAAALIGEVGTGFKRAQSVRSDGQVRVAAALLGAQRRLLQAVTAHAADRKQYGRALRDLQLVKQRVAGMTMRLYATETLVDMVAVAAARGDDTAIDAALAKTFAEKAALEAADAAKQIVGAAAYLDDHPVAALANDIDGYRFVGGTAELNQLLAALKGLEHTGKALKSKSTATVMLNRTKRTLGIMNGSDGAHSSLAAASKLLDEKTTMLGAALETVLMKFGKKIMNEQIVVAQAAEAVGMLYSMAAVIARASAAFDDADVESADAQHEALIAATWCRECTLPLTEICEDLRNVYGARFGDLARIADHVAGAGGYIPTPPAGA